LKLGIDVERFLSEWALEHSGDLVEELEIILENDSITNEHKLKAIYSKTLNFVFAAITVSIKENNKQIEKQLRRAGVQLP
jgi:hypothetical protein